MRTRRRLKVLVTARRFWPRIGGIEAVSERLAEHLVDRGHAAKVLTLTPADPAAPDPQDWRFSLMRDPNPLRQLAAHRWADVVISRHMAARCDWPLLLTRRPHVVWHALAYPSDDPFPRRWIRERLLARAIGVANSADVAARLEGDPPIVHPGYDEAVFRATTTPADRAIDYAFVGRLSAEKGCDLLLEGLARLPERRLWIIGDGDERPALEALAARLGVADRVAFLGKRRPGGVNAALNACRVLVVPSLWEEAFGRVAVEGQAAGCRVVISTGGGLVAAAGPGAVVFRSGDREDLIRAMRAAETPLTPAQAAAVATHLDARRLTSALDQIAALAEAAAAR